MTLQQIDLHNTITALSCALDLVGVDEVKHGKRVAMMAYHIARHLQWPDAECLSILHAGMLHDCGVSSIHEHRMITDSLEWAGAEAHAIRGAEYLAACSPLAHLAADIRYHHSRWQLLNQLPIAKTTRVRANLLFLADRVDVLQLPYLRSEQILSASTNIVRQIQSLSGSLFAPELVTAFSETAQSQSFWLAMDDDYMDEDIHALGLNTASIAIDYPTLREIAHLFSRVVDAKSHFTELHSQRVALLARQLAIDLGITEQIEEIEIAGLLHDLGKLRVSEDIINKPGKLSPEERAIMQRHSYDTFRILQRVFGNSKIPVWAGFHHENLRGEGYPFKSSSACQDIESRIICVADIFQALAQSRPYREGMKLADILQDLTQRVENGELDAHVVNTIKANAQSYYQLAGGLA